MTAELVGDATKTRVFAAMFDNTCATLLSIPIAARAPLPLSPVGRGITLVAIYLGYFLLQEGLWGATLGKRIFKLRVIQLDGSPAGWRASFWRTLLRILEVNPVLLGMIPGGLVVTWSRRKQRLGDMLAHTIVFGMALPVVIVRPPDPRVRRTRPDASLRGSPLTRHPLGNARNMVAAVVLTLVSTSPFACASVQTSRLAVVTVAAVDPRGDVIPGVTVVLRHTHSGQRLEATTSSSGEATFEVSEPGEWIAIGQQLGTIAPKPVQILVPDGGRVKTKIVIDPTIIDSLEVK